MKSSFLVFLRNLLFLTLAVALAACQSTPRKPGFTAAQLAVLKAEGFVPVEDDWVLTLPNRLLFPSDKSSLETATLEDIANLARNLVTVDIRTVVVEGHTDSVGSNAYNLQLSKARAQTVAAPLTANGMRLTPEQIIGRGETLPIADNGTPQGRQDNRRVAIIVSPE